jgi:hypothetical protein
MGIVTRDPRSFIQELYRSQGELARSCIGAMQDEPTSILHADIGASGLLEACRDSCMHACMAILEA